MFTRLVRDWTFLIEKIITINSDLVFTLKGLCATMAISRDDHGTTNNYVLLSKIKIEELEERKFIIC